MQATQPALSAVQPSLQVLDVRRSVAFYVDQLGFSSRGVFEMDGVAVHAEVSSGAVTFMFGPKDSDQSRWQAELAAGAAPGVGVYFYVSLDDGIDAYYDGVRAAGAPIVEEIGDRFWGDRTFTIEDPDGYILQFSQHVRDFPAEMMEGLKAE